ncbi:UNVERIFIED_CONTAM: acetyl-CoA synthetase [Trichonephila clavipes]
MKNATIFCYLKIKKNSHKCSFFYHCSDDVFIQKGERFGAADVYFAIHDVEEIQDYICVGQKKRNGDPRAVLFVKMRDGYSFTPEFKDKIANKIKSELWEDCVPELILEVKDIPVSNRDYTIPLRSYFLAELLYRVVIIKVTPFRGI